MIEANVRGSKAIDDSMITTQLYYTIYQLLFESRTITDSDDTQDTINVLRSDFDNVKLRNIILMLLLANDVKLVPNVAFRLQLH